MAGSEAKLWGEERRYDWRKKQKLWWMGVEYDRHSVEYQMLVGKAYRKLFVENLAFRKALISTVNLWLIHSIGSSDPNKTILTEREFIINHLIDIRTIALKAL